MGCKENAEDGGWGVEVLCVVADQSVVDDPVYADAPTRLGQDVLADSLPPPMVGEGHQGIVETTSQRTRSPSSLSPSSYTRQHRPSSTHRALHLEEEVSDEHVVTLLCQLRDECDSAGGGERAWRGKEAIDAFLSNVGKIQSTPARMTWKGRIPQLSVASGGVGRADASISSSSSVHGGGGGRGAKARPSSAGGNSPEQRAAARRAELAWSVERARGKQSSSPPSSPPPSSSPLSSSSPFLPSSPLAHPPPVASSPPSYHLSVNRALAAAMMRCSRPRPKPRPTRPMSAPHTRPPPVSEVSSFASALISLSSTSSRDRRHSLRTSPSPASFLAASDPRRLRPASASRLPTASSTVPGPRTEQGSRIAFLLAASRHSPHTPLDDIRLASLAASSSGGSRRPFSAPVRRSESTQGVCLASQTGGITVLLPVVRDEGLMEELDAGIDPMGSTGSFRVWASGNEP